LVFQQGGEEVQVMSPNPVSILSKHLKARGVNLRPVANGGQDDPLAAVFARDFDITHKADDSGD
jgi:hypothetical protein